MAFHLQEQDCIEAERIKLEVLERQHMETKRLLAASSGLEAEQLLAQCHHEQELIDIQRRVFDDLEFQQLEVGKVTVKSLKMDGTVVYML